MMNIISKTDPNVDQLGIFGQFEKSDATLIDI